MADDFDWPDDVAVAQRRVAFVDKTLEENRQWRIEQGFEENEDLLGQAVDHTTPESFADRDYAADPHLADRLGLNGPMRRLAPPPIRFGGPDESDFDMPHAPDVDLGLSTE